LLAPETRRRNRRKPPRVPGAGPAIRSPIMKGVLAWLIGIPIPIIILLYLFDVF
jgi:hypothetical protein